MSGKNQCSRCGGKVVYFRAYSGEKMCSDCFMSSLVNKTRRTISKYNMLNYGDKVAVAVSGGKDSLTLLHVLHNLSKKYGSKLIAISVDEGISGYRDEAIRNVVSVANSLHIPYKILSFNDVYSVDLDKAISKRLDKGLSSCTICGILRKRTIDILAKTVNADVVATAHNLDDVLQTFLINLLSGDSRRAITSLPAQEITKGFSARRIRPFMEIPEAEIVFYAFLNNIPFQSQDCPYMNESIRSEIRLILNDLEKKHPGIKYNLLKSSVDVSSLRIKQNKSYFNCSNCGFPSSNAICSVCEIVNTLKLRYPK